MVLLPNETFFFEGGRLFVWAYLRPLLARMLLIARSRSFSSQLLGWCRYLVASLCRLYDLLLRLFELRDLLLSEEGVLSRQSGDGRYLLELYLSGLLGDGVLRSYLSRDFSLEYLSGLYGEGVHRSYLSRDFSPESSLLDLSLCGDFLSLQCLLVCGEGIRRPLLLLGASLWWFFCSWWGLVSADVAAFLVPILLPMVFVVSLILWCRWGVMSSAGTGFFWCVFPASVFVFALGLCGGALFPFMMGGWVDSGFTGLCVLWCSFWFDADFSYWGGLLWWFFIFRCCGLPCWDGDISQSCFMDELAVVASCALAHEIESTDYRNFGCSLWWRIGVCFCCLLFFVLFFCIDRHLLE